VLKSMIDIHEYLV